MKKELTFADITFHDGELVTEDELFERFEHHHILLRREDGFFKEHPGYWGFLVASTPVNDEPEYGAGAMLLDNYMEDLWAKGEGFVYSVDYTYPPSEGSRFW
ncbi:MAG: hypothetical protein FWG65_02945 [Turicibacter sp.]|nr:hypothetical protein [Turicibacter sp.]